MLPNADWHKRASQWPTQNQSQTLHRRCCLQAPHNPWSSSQSNTMMRARSQDVPNPMDHIGGKVWSTLDKVWTSENAADLENTTWKAHIHAAATWKALLSHGREHFSQASNTPFATGTIAIILGPLEWNEASKQILNGTFNIDWITSNVHVRDIMKAMAHYDLNNPMQSSSQLMIPKIKSSLKFIIECTSSNLEGPPMDIGNPSFTMMMPLNHLCSWSCLPFTGMNHQKHGKTPSRSAYQKMNQISWSRSTESIGSN